jgi:hypothetical protein
MLNSRAKLADHIFVLSGNGPGNSEHLSHA